MHPHLANRLHYQRKIGLGAMATRPVTDHTLNRISEAQQQTWISLIKNGFMRENHVHDNSITLVLIKEVTRLVSWALGPQSVANYQLPALTCVDVTAIASHWSNSHMGHSFCDRDYEKTYLTLNCYLKRHSPKTLLFKFQLLHLYSLTISSACKTRKT